MIKEMEKESILIIKVDIMMGNGKMILRRERAFMYIGMGTNMKENIKMTLKMEKDAMNGCLEKNLLGTLLMD